MSYRSHRDSSWRRFWHYHGQKVAVALLVLLVLTVVGLLMWFMTDMRFRSRSASRSLGSLRLAALNQHPALAQQGLHGAVHEQFGQRM
jgi:hypothetical protein